MSRLTKQTQAINGATKPLSLNIGSTFGLGQTKSTAWSKKFSDLLK